MFGLAIFKFKGQCSYTLLVLGLENIVFPTQLVHGCIPDFVIGFPLSCHFGNTVELAIFMDKYPGSSEKANEDQGNNDLLQHYLSSWHLDNGTLPIR